MQIAAKHIARGLRTEGVQNRGRQAILNSRTWSDLQEALDAGSAGTPGGIAPKDFRLRDLAAHTIFSRNGDPVGYEFVEEFFDPTNQYLQEGMAAVDASAFAGITGQLLINRVLAAFQAEDFVFSKLIPNQPTRLNGERIPGVALPRDAGEDFVVAEEMDELHYVGFTEEYIETPATTKRQVGIAITKEAIFFDRTGLVLDRASYVGTLLGLRKEKNLILTAIGANETYQEKRTGDSAAVSLPTYMAADDAGRWINHLDGNGLTDWTNINLAEQTFAQMVDPNTGEPIILPGRRVLIAPQVQALSLNQLMQAQQVWKATQGGITATTPPGVATIGANPLMDLQITMALSRQMLKQLTAAFGLAITDAANYWLYGDPAAFAYMENWPITVVQAPTNSEAEFTQDIVVRFKASERGEAAIIEPRRMIRSRAISTSSSSGASLPVIV
jgi:hypothetical protein